MRIQILTVGDNRVPYLIEGEEDYLRRLTHYCPVEIRVVKGEKIKTGRSIDSILKKESERLLKQISEGSKIIALDRQGKSFSSEELAVEMQEWQNSGIKYITFVIGGPLGLGEGIRKKADTTISMSRFTFTHEMVRIIMLEQLYRVFTILRGEKYHK
jgi:23S rRNA (pseudouridine1915-N3)-methyltransferase